MLEMSIESLDLTKAVSYLGVGIEIPLIDLFGVVAKEAPDTEYEPMALPIRRLGQGR